ncbi:synaptic vesicle 2-related protein [Plakobranchus ocellatus]|uniref:Synaptic vesicle 2-related protein n=1 Tax=Plakobranchus ocellatus TaxID=259542 RepID=A0AAV4A5B1_9GAST|nr:synaptic vesicle 2-related protein [Plakobranchus ocellatus]
MAVDSLLKTPNGNNYNATSNTIDSSCSNDDRESGAGKSKHSRTENPDGKTDCGDCVMLVSDKKGNVKYSIQESIDASGLGWFQVKLSIVAGFTWMADSMEIMLLSILGPVLSCDWFLASWEQALLTTMVMTGMMLGSSYWGSLTDKYGRKTALTLATVLIGYFGFLSAFSPMYIWMIICRFLVGCCLAALPQTAVLYSEFLPTKARPAGLLFLGIFWALGAAFEVILAMLVMPTLGWRYLMAFSAAPVMLFPIFNPWMPESARFYMTCGRYHEAEAMLKMVAKDNKKPMLEGTLSTDDIKPVERGRVRDMLKPPHRTLSCSDILKDEKTFCFVECRAFTDEDYKDLIVTAFADLPGSDILKDEKTFCFVECRAFTEEDYKDLIVTAFADLPGLLVAFVFLQFFGRKSSMAISNFLAATCLLISNICMTRLYLTGFLFVARAMIAGGYQVLFIYTTESYPTNIRAVGMGVTSAAAKLGSLITPFIAQVLSGYSASLTFSLYGVMALLATVVALVLPFDTRGRAMVDVTH